MGFVLIKCRKGIPITDPHFWQDQEECTLDSLRHIFRSCTDEEMPLLAERLACLREAGNVLYEVGLVFSPVGIALCLALTCCKEIPMQSREPDHRC